MNTDLIAQSRQLQDIIDRGSDWLNQHAEPEKRRATLNELGKLRRRAKRLEQAAGLRPTLAMFGISQVGKSFLVSNLARSSQQSVLQIDGVGLSESEVATVLNTPGPISFIDHINPKSENNEATGVITRFTTHYDPTARGYKVRLFSQTDLVKVLTTAYQRNIQVEYEAPLEDRTILATIDKLQQMAVTGAPQPGMTADDVLDVRDFVQNVLFDKAVAQNLHRHEYWDAIAESVARLDPAERYQAFSFLWHQNPFFDQLFQQLSRELGRLHFATEGWCGLEAIAPTTHTIVDVTRLSEWDGNPKGDVAVRVAGGGTVQVGRSVLTALTAELVLPLPKSIANDPARRFLQEADILDFPGARSWEQKSRDVFDESDTSEKMSTFLRGKVAYLFDRYNETFEISSLLFCHDNSQVNVNTLPKLLYDWIKANVGASVEAREAREQALLNLVPADVRGDLQRVNPFFFILTKINTNLNASDRTKEGQPQEHDQKWNSRLVKNYSDPMSKATLDKWTESWNRVGGMKNTFIVRDPNPKFSEPCYAQSGGVEVVNEPFRSVFNDLRTSFVNHPDVNNYFYDPARMWQEAIEPGQTGLPYLIRYLTPACHPAIKNEQIKAALEAVRHEAGRELCTHYEGGSVEEKLKRARERRDRVIRPMRQLVKDRTLGQFLATLAIAEQHRSSSQSGLWDRDLCRQLMTQPDTYLKKATQASVSAEAETPQNDALDDVLDGLFDGGATPTPVAEKPASLRKTYTLADCHAEELLGRWVVQLKDNADSGAFRQQFGLQKDDAATVIEEVVRCMERDGLKERLADQTNPFMPHMENLELVVSISRALVNEFVETLGWSRVSSADKLANKAAYKLTPEQVAPIFDGAAVAIPDKTTLKTERTGPGSEQDLQRYTHWLLGFHAAFEYNVLREANLSDPDRARINGLLESIIRELNYTC
jgi:hypothetical protein